MGKFLAFIDVVGMRDLAAREAGEDEFVRVLDQYHTHLAGAVGSLGDSGRVYFFSDSAFVETDDLTRLLNYLWRVRNLLLPQGIYFKGAVTDGDLAANMPSQCILAQDGDPGERDERVYGCVFGARAAHAYAMQERLKGIGISVDQRIAKAVLKGVAGLCVTNCHVSAPPNRGVVPFLDIALRSTDQTAANFEELLHQLLLARSRARTIARYYVPILANWVRSAALTEPKRGERGLADPAQAFVLEGRLARLASGVVGLEAIYFSLVDRLFSSRAAKELDPRVVDDLRRKLIRQSRFRNSAAPMPPSVLSDESRSEFTKLLVRHIK